MHLSQLFAAIHTHERTAISTWVTGAPEGNNISSFEAHINNIVGKGNFENVIKRALHPNANAKTVEQRFSTKFPINWYIDALASYGLQLEHLYYSRTEDVTSTKTSCLATPIGSIGRPSVITVCLISARVRIW